MDFSRQMTVAPKVTVRSVITELEQVPDADHETSLEHLRTLADMALDKTNEGGCVKIALAVVMDIMKAPHSPQHHAECVRFLSALTFHAVARDEMVRRAVVPRLLGALSLDDDSTQLHAIKALVNCTCELSHRRVVVEAGGPAAIVDAMLKDSNFADFQKEAARCLINLSFLDGGQNSIVEAGGLHAIKEAMLHSPTQPTVQYEGLRAIFNLSYQNPTNKAKIVEEEDLIPVIASALHEFRANDNVLLYGFQVLINLALVSEDNRKAIKDEGTIGVAIQAKKIPNAKLYNKVCEFERILEGDISAADLPGDSAPDTNLYAATHPLPLGFLIHGIQRRVQANMLSTDLFIYIPFLILFILSVVAANSNEQVFYAVEAVREQLAGNEIPNLDVVKTYLDLANVEDWQSWFKLVAIPSLWTPLTDKGVRYPMGQNMLLGSLRVRTIRTEKSACDTDYTVWGDTPGDCWEPYSQKNEQKTYTWPDPFPSPECTQSGSGAAATEPTESTEPTDTPEVDVAMGSGEETVIPSVVGGQNHCGYYVDEEICEAKGGVYTTGENSLYHCGGHTLDIPFNLPIEKVNEQVSHLFQTGVIDNTYTRMVMVEFFTYAPQYDTFIAYKFFYEVTAGGGWLVNLQSRVFKVWNSTYVSKTIFDTCFFAYVLYYVYRFVHEGLRQRRIFATRPLAYVMEFWNLLEIVNLVCFFMVFVAKWIWLNHSRKMEYRFPMEGYPERLDIILLSYSFTNYLNAINTILTVLKILKYVRMNDALNIVTRTLDKCMSGIVGCLSIFILIVFGYAVCGVFVYGSEIKEMRNINSAFSTLLRQLLGDFDYDEMRKANRFLTFIYFWTFITLGLFLYLNFLIAIITDAFTEVTMEQMLESLDKQLARAAQEIKFSFSLSAIMQRLYMYRRRSGVTDVLRRLLDEHLVPYRKRVQAQRNWMQLAAYVRTMRKKTLADAWMTAVDQSEANRPVDETLMHGSQVKNMLPKELMEIMGDIYYNNIWEGLVWQFELLAVQPAQQERRELQDRAEYCTRASTKDLKGVVKTFHERLKQMETTTTKVTTTLASRMSKKARSKQILAPASLAAQLNRK